MTQEQYEQFKEASQYYEQTFTWWCGEFKKALAKHEALENEPWSPEKEVKLNQCKKILQTLRDKARRENTALDTFWEDIKTTL